ncbi:MAG: glutamate--tRNA ligase [Candidatus Magasanikbacteria bacterium]|nr:glutamate--tRNA ligase [Candidatus Magasanikbacteria bacterium]
MTKTRFAPSPTGFLHVGGLRTALYAYLLARKESGIFALRIEDTDQERFVEGGIENIISSLKWAGMHIDEGVDLDENNLIIQKGNCGPYIQSQRLEMYHTYTTQLLEQQDAYYCFCTKDRLEEVRNCQQTNKLPTGYDGRCREIDPAEAQKRAMAGETHVIRMKMPKTGFTAVDDLVRGHVEFKNELIDDQVLLKADGFPTYHLAVVVDDHFMEFTHVIRGEEWLPSTPKHIKLYEMFGWEKPKFAHLSLMVNEQKQKLSKRHGSVSVQDFVEKGYVPEALINFIAFLGWNPGDEREIFSLQELEQEFDMTKVSKAAAVFNLEKLNWYNKHYIMNLSIQELAKRCEPFYLNSGIDIRAHDLTKIVALEQGRASTLVEIVEHTGFVFAEHLEYEPELLVWKKSTAEDAKEKLSLILEFLKNKPEGEWAKEILEPTVIEWIASKDFGNGDILWPTRVALSGLKNSPGPFELMSVLGKEKTIRRILTAINYI